MRPKQQQNRPVVQIGKLFDREPPHAPEAEMALLGAIILGPKVLPEVMAILPDAAAFYSERHQILFATMLDLHERATAIDLVTMMQGLKDRGHFDKVGGVRTLSELLDRSGTVTNLEHYCEIVRQWSTFHPEFAQLHDSSGRHDAYAMVILGFRNSIYAWGYIFCMLMLGAHLSHGISSAFHTLGFYHSHLQPWIKAAGALIGWGIAVGYIIIPLSVQLGLL